MDIYVRSHQCRKFPFLHTPLPSKKDAWTSIHKAICFFKKRIENFNKEPLVFDTYKATTISLSLTWI